MDRGGGSTRTELGDAVAEADDAIAKIMIRSPKVVVMWDVNCTRAGVWIRLIKRIGPKCRRFLLTEPARFMTGERKCVS